MNDVRISQLWRYPVKSLRGESLTSTELTLDGIPGDRIIHVAGPHGPLTGRTHQLRVHLARAMGEDDRRIILDLFTKTGLKPNVVFESGGTLPCQARIARMPARLRSASRRAAAAPRRRRRNLLVATDGAVARLGHDVRRLRPNIVLSGVDADLEPDMPGRALEIGDALVGVHSVRQRCVVTTIDPDTGNQDLSVLRRIRDVFDGELALNCWVIRPGHISVDDPVRIVASTEYPDDIGGWIVGAPYAHATR